MHDLYVQARRNICFTKPDENDRRTDLINYNLSEDFRAELLHQQGKYLGHPIEQ